MNGSGKQWYFKQSDQILGPYSTEELQEFATRGVLKPATPVANSQDGPWFPADNIREPELSNLGTRGTARIARASERHLANISFSLKIIMWIFVFWTVLVLP